MTITVAMLDPHAYLSAMTRAAGVLEDHAVGLDLLEVDLDPLAVDTDPPRGIGPGSDVAATLSAAVTSAGSSSDFASMCASMSAGARDAAHGRSGRSMASFIEGLAEVFANADRIDAQRFALGLEAAAERLAPADDGRHPGGFTAVANAAADAALDAADRGLDLAGTVIAAAGAGVEELERGPALDARLADRGTVDGAAAGLLLVLDSLASILTGEPLPEPPAEAPMVAANAGSGGATGANAIDADASVGLSYEIGCHLIPDEAGVVPAAELEEHLASMGDVTRFEPSDARWVISVTATNPGPVVETLSRYGQLREVKISLDPVVIEALASATAAAQP